MPVLNLFQVYHHGFLEQRAENTPCVQVKVDDTELIFDAGTGIRVLGKSQFLPEDNHYNLFFSLFKNSSKETKSVILTERALLPSNGPTIPAASN